MNVSFAFSVCEYVSGVTSGALGAGAEILGRTAVAAETDARDRVVVLDVLFAGGIEVFITGKA
jgi:hypothetical protein